MLVTASVLLVSCFLVGDSVEFISTGVSVSTNDCDGDGVSSGGSNRTISGMLVMSEMRQWK